MSRLWYLSPGMRGNTRYMNSTRSASSNVYSNLNTHAHTHARTHTQYTDTDPPPTHTHTHARTHIHRHRPPPPPPHTHTHIHTNGPVIMLFHSGSVDSFSMSIDFTIVAMLFERRLGLLCYGAGIAQWLERRTRDWKVADSNPCRSGGRIFFSKVDFLCWFISVSVPPPCYRSSA